MTVRWTEHASRRLLAIEAHVARDNPAAAAALAERLVDRASMRARFPRMGRPVPEMPGAGLRERIVGAYRIVYRVRGDDVEVLTVFESHRGLRPDEIPSG